MTLLIDSREKGNLPQKVAHEIPNNEVKALDAGDYWIPKQQGFILIERSTYSDFIGKIISGRLWEQVRKCKEASDDVYFLLENPFMQKFSKVSYKAIVAAKASLSREVRLFETRNASETLVFIKKLYDKYNSDDNKEFKEVRVKPKKMSYYEQARFMLLGLNGVGDSTVNKIFESYGSLYNVLRTKENELADVVGERLANQIRNVLHATK